MLEQLLIHDEPFEEVSPVQSGGLLERLWCPFRRQPLEGQHVDVDGLGLRRDRVAGDAKGARQVPSQSRPKHEQRLPERVARVAFFGVSPEEGRELFALVSLPRPERAVREQGLGFLRGQGDGGP